MNAFPYQQRADRRSGSGLAIQSLRLGGTVPVPQEDADLRAEQSVAAVKRAIHARALIDYEQCGLAHHDVA
jgi:hypothetical protein